MTPKTTTAPENPAPREDTGYHSIRYHCPACNFAFDIGGFVPANKLPQEPIFLCPKCHTEQEPSVDKTVNEDSREYSERER